MPGYDPKWNRRPEGYRPPKDERITNPHPRGLVPFAYVGALPAVRANRNGGGRHLAVQRGSEVDALAAHGLREGGV